MSPETGRRLSVAAAALGVALVIVGAVVAYAGYERTSGPAGAVRGYYAALADADAPRALAWGTLPAGPHTLLTSAVLAEQQRLAPIRDVAVGAAQRSGDRARVPVTYRLGFAAGERLVRQTLTVVDHDGDWRLAAVAVPVQLQLSAAARRATVLHAAVPTGTVLLFPGALPVTFDTAYLALDSATDAVGFGAPAELDVGVRVTAAGRAAATAAVRAALARCLAGGDVSCPLPGERYVPGSLRGTLTSVSGGSVQLLGSPDGVLDVTGTAGFTGSYQELTFADLRRSGTGSLTLQLHADAYAVAPLRVRWTT